MTRDSRLPDGVKVIVGFHVFRFFMWVVGQTGAAVAYDSVAELGLQDPRAVLDPVIVELNRATGLADTLIMLPMFIVAAIGLLRRRLFGAVASWLAFASRCTGRLSSGAARAFLRRRASIAPRPRSRSSFFLVCSG